MDISAAEEPAVGYFQAWCVSDAELLCHALVFPAPERKGSAQCRGPTRSLSGLHLCLCDKSVSILEFRPCGRSLTCATTCYSECPGSYAVVAGADQYHGGERQPHGSRWFPGWTHLQGMSSAQSADLWVFSCSSISLTYNLAHCFTLCQYVDKPGVAFCTNLTGNNNSITNAVDIYQAPK